MITKKEENMGEAEYYEPGDLIYTCDEFAHVISEKYRNKYCDYCCSQSSCIKLCTRCKSVGYCSSKCRKLARPQHQDECLGFDYIRRLKMKNLLTNKSALPSKHLLDFIFLVVRIIRKLKFGDGKTVSETFGSQKITFDEIQWRFSPGELSEMMKQNKMHQCSLKSVLDACFASKDVLPNEEINDILGKVAYNKAPLRYENEFGLYFSLGRALFHCGCKPNAVSVPTKLMKHEIRATKRIRKDGSEKICLATVHIVDSYCPHCFRVFFLTHKRRNCNECFHDSSITTSELSDKKSRQDVIKEAYKLADQLFLLINGGGKALPDIRVKIDNCIIRQKEVLGATHVSRLRLLIWKILIDPLDLFAVKHSERSLIYLVKLAFGEKSYELFTVYCHLTAIYATHKKLKIAKVYREKRNELGSLYHQIPLSYEADGLINEIEKTKNK